MTEMHVDIGMSDHATILRLQGALDGEGGAVVRDCVDASGHAGGAVVVDLTRVRSIDSAGVSTLVSIHRSLALDLRRLDIVGVQGEVRRVLELSGVAGMLKVA